MFKKFLTLLVLFSAITSAGMAFAAAIDVNKANDAELDSIKGIGPAMSGKIISERQKAPFKDWTDFINRTKGIGPTAAKRLSAQGLSVGGAPYSEAAGEASNKSDSKKTTQNPVETAQTTVPTATAGTSPTPTSSQAAKTTKPSATPTNAATPSATPKSN